MTVKSTLNATKLPGIPRIPANVDPQTRQVLEAIIEAVEIRLGRKGDPTDRAITLRELVDSGLAQQLKTAPYDPNNYNSTNTGIAPTGVIPTEPYAPLGFTASGAYSTVNLMWTPPFYRGHSQTEIYRSSVNTLSSAIAAGPIALVSGFGYSDPVGSDFTGYYWIRFVNTASVAGPWNNAAGTLAQTSPDIDHLLSVLSNGITSSELAQSLATPIASIPSMSNTLSALNNDVSTINGQISTLNSTVAALNNTSAWASGQSYSTNDQVTYSGNLFSAKSNHTSTSGNAPPTSNASNTTWLFVGAYTSLSAAVGANTGSITQLNTVSASSTSAAARAINALNSTVDNAQTGVVATANALDVIETAVNHTNTGVVASSQKITALETTVNNAQTGVAATATALDAVETTVNHGTTGVSASASKIGALETTVNNATTGVAATAAAVSAIATEVFPNGAASASRLDTLEVDVGNLSTGGNASALTALTTEVFPNGSAAASRIDGLEATVNDSTTGVAATSTALNTVETLVNNTSTGVTATANSVSGLQTTVGNNTASISTQATSINGLSAQYSVKVDTNGHVAGFGLSSTLIGDTPSSAFIVRADKFALVTPNDNTAPSNDPTGDGYNVPFIVTAAGSDNLGNSWDAGVYIRNAVIRDGDITNAKIGTIDAGKITTGNLDVTTLLTANQIDVGKLNLVGAGQTINLRSADSGARMVITGPAITIYDGNDTPRVKLGAL